MTEGHTDAFHSKRPYYQAECSMYFWIGKWIKSHLLIPTFLPKCNKCIDEMLHEVWRKRNSPTLLLGIQISAVTMENIMKVP